MNRKRCNNESKNKCFHHQPKFTNLWEEFKANALVLTEKGFLSSCHSLLGEEEGRPLDDTICGWLQRRKIQLLRKGNWQLRPPAQKGVEKSRTTWARALTTACPYFFIFCLGHCVRTELTHSWTSAKEIKCSKAYFAFFSNLLVYRNDTCLLNWLVLSFVKRK